MADRKKDIVNLGKDQQIDPVCGMIVNEKEAAGSDSFQGEKYYFCSDECKDKFETRPQEYAVSVVPKA